MVMAASLMHNKAVAYAPALLKLKRKLTKSGCVFCCSFRVGLVVGSPYCSETLMMFSVGLVASKVISPSAITPLVLLQGLLAKLRQLVMMGGSMPPSG